jgi:hypothetical protein
MGVPKPCLPIVAFASVCLAGCPGDAPRVRTDPAKKQAPKAQPEREGIEGWYVLDHAAFYGAVIMKDVPPGQVVNMAVRDGRWMMANMLSGWGGTYRETKDGVVFTSVMGPAGPTEPEEIKVAKTDRGLVLNAGEKLRGVSTELRFTYQGPDLPRGFDLDTFLGPKK